MIAVARQLARKIRMMSTTRIAPSRSACTTLSTATSMKSAWRKMWRSRAIPFGSAPSMSSSTSSRRSVKARVLASGCFWMPMMTASRPLNEPSPRFSAGAMTTSPRSATVTGWPSRIATWVSPMSEIRSMRPRP